MLATDGAVDAADWGVKRNLLRASVGSWLGALLTGVGRGFPKAGGGLEAWLRADCIRSW